MLRFHRTSLLTSPAQTLVNTVNTVGVMGKGLAAEFKKLYPEMFNEYKLKCDRGELAPGSIWLWKGQQQWVLNFATKKHWRNPSKIAYVVDGLRQFRVEYERLGIREIAFPRLGCGNGGLDWKEVRPIMIDYLGDLPIRVYIHDFEKSIGHPEHELELMKSSEPLSFEGFLRDMKSALEAREGNISALMHAITFRAKLDEDFDLKGGADCNELLASKEDLFRIWNLLLDAPVSRSDLPDVAYENALKVFSVLAELPYARPVNIANRQGRNNLAIEFRRSTAADSALTSLE